MAPALRLNENITFGKTGSVRGMDPYGFDLGEPGMSWTQEEVAGFSLVLASPPADLQLRFKMGVVPFIQAGHIERQQLYIFINGLFVGFRTLTVAEKLEFPLSRSALSVRGLRVELVVPTAMSPKALGISNDVRRLGIAVSEVSIAGIKAAVHASS